MRDFLEMLLAVFLTENMFFPQKKEKEDELSHKIGCDGASCEKNTASCKSGH